MIHIDKDTFKIRGTVGDLAGDFIEIMNELVKIGILDPAETKAAFLVNAETGNMIEYLLNDTSVVTVSKYGGN